VADQSTKNKQDTIPILFTAGMYGTFLHWALSYFSGLTDLASPHTNLGNSHKFNALHLKNIAGWREYASGDRYSKLVRLHPRVFADDHVVPNINEILHTVNKLIIIYHTDDYLSLALNNKFEKIWAHGWLVERQAEFVDKLKNWGKSSLHEMETWQLREFLSLYIYQQHNIETEYKDLCTYFNPKVYKLDIHDMIYNFEDTITNVLSYCNLPLIRNNFEEVYQEWISYQKHLKKDKVVNTIVDSVINNYTFDWSDQNLTLVDEAIVQMRLRDLHKLDLTCYNLNVFPTNTNDLQKLLIDV
jgi:transcription termination factor NusB